MNGRSVIRPRSYFVGAAALVLAGLVLGLGLSAGLNLQRSSRAASAELAAVTNSAPLPESPFVGVVEKALPAVVFIDVQKKASASNDPNDEFLRRFFSDQMPRHPQRMPSSGSGFIIDAQGRIMTNNHVVSNADEINVTLNDRRTFKAHVIGADPETDVAVIQIDGARDLPVLPLGDSDRLRVGDWAIAIGNPLGELRGSVTVGIVSAQGRTNLNIYGGTPEYQDFIQTDASINFGNSGGPLCNIRGEAIGINTAINTTGQGIGFAVPINLARHVAEQLVAHGSVRRAMLGVMLAEMTPDIAEGFGLAGQQGVLIQRVMDNTPAARAGLLRNDVIVEFNGQPVSDMQKLRLKVADTAPGRPVSMVVLREGKRVSVNVTLTDKDEKTASNVKEGGDADATPNLAGLTVRDLREDEKRQLGIENGVRVTDVEDASVADDKGIQPNDVIEMVGPNPVKDAATFSHLMAAARKAGRPAVLYVNRNGNSQYVPLRLDK
jgi:Do/DeqQ family serine protease